MNRISILLLAFLFLLAGCSKKKTDEAKETDQTETLEHQEDADDTESEQDAEADSDADEDAEADDEDVERVTQRWYVAGEKVACGASEDEQCFRIRRAGNPEWEVIQGDIKGFELNEDVMSILEVEISKRTIHADVEDDAEDDSAAEQEEEVVEERYEMTRQISPLPEGQEEETCTSQADCDDGEMCTGPAGCNIPWTCEPMRPCTKDLRAYCSCEGETIEGSGSCPPAPYKHVGPCKDTE